MSANADVTVVITCFNYGGFLAEAYGGRLTVGVGVGTALVALVLYSYGAFEALEQKSVDVRFQWRGSRPVNPDIVVVTVDEESIEKLGRWPWTRSYHAELI